MFYKHSSVSRPAKHGQFTDFTFGWTHAFDSKQTKIPPPPPRFKAECFSLRKNFLRKIITLVPVGSLTVLAVCRKVETQALFH